MWHRPQRLLHYCNWHFGRHRHLFCFVWVGTALSPVCAQTTDPELAFMPRTATVNLLNPGGKFVALDLKHIDQGGACRMDKDATIVRVGQGAVSGTTRVRYAAAQLSSGGCPFLTEFELADADYAAARKAFTDAKDAAKKRWKVSRKSWGTNGMRS